MACVGHDFYSERREDSMTETSLRRAFNADVEALARIHLDARRAICGQFPPPVHDEVELVPHLLADVLPVAEVWVAEREGQPAGFLVLEGELLDQLYVSPKAQGYGVGTALLEHAKTQRPRGLQLRVFLSNTLARTFYAHHGFVQTGSSDGSDNEEGAPDVQMTWTA